ncbi:MAG: restriction endonuclease subunit S [Holophagales bacterium]|jgi:type I restriction enzyme S subunit|nr:restriction endonuclease subunit S [Holophagales bacterium]
MVTSWNEKKLGDISEIRMCKRIFANQTTPTGEIPFFKIGTFGKEPDAYISRSLYDEYRSKYSFPCKRDILLSAAGTLGRTVVYDGKPAYFQDSNIVWLEIDQSQICNEYLNHCYQVMKWASPEGSTISRLYNGIIRDTDIKLPPLSEQRRIAEVLSDTDALIAAMEKLIAKKRAIKQGAMQGLLTGRLRLPGFEGEWVETTLGSIGDFSKGRGISKDEAHSGKIPCVRYGEIYTHHNDYVKEFNSYISEEVAESSRYLRIGELLFAGSGETKEEIGKCVAFTNQCEAYAGGDIIILTLRIEADSLFLGFYLNSRPIAEQKASRGQGDAIVHISAASLAEIEIQLPAFSEQTAIAEILSDMDAEIDALAAKLSKLRNIKQGMLSELLTGRIRLVEEKMPLLRVAEEQAEYHAARRELTDAED